MYFDGVESDSPLEIHTSAVGGRMETMTISEWKLPYFQLDNIALCVFDYEQFALTSSLFRHFALYCYVNTSNFPEILQK